MSWENRQPDSTDDPGHLPLVMRSAVLPLFSARGISVHLHAALAVAVALLLLLGLGAGFTRRDRIEAVSVLIALVAIRESARFAVAYHLKSKSRDLVLSPFGGPARPTANDVAPTVSVAVGASMLLNAVICVLALVVIRAVDHTPTINPITLTRNVVFPGWLSVGYHARWVYAIGLVVLAIGVLPVYPFDVGRMVHALLTSKIGFTQATLFASVTGMAGSIVLMLFGVSLRSWPILVVAGCCFVECLCLRWMLHHTADKNGFASDDAEVVRRSRRRRRLSRRAIMRLRRRAQRDAMEIRQLDLVLQKVSTLGLQSLTWRERRVLRRATQRHREFDEDLEDRPAMQ